MKYYLITSFIAFLLAAGCGGNGDGDQDAQEDGVDQADQADQTDDAAPPDNPQDQPDQSDATPDTPTDNPLDQAEEDAREEPPPCTGESWAFITVSDSYSGLEGNLQAALQSAFQYNDDLKFIVSTGDFENLDEIDGNIQADLLSYFPGRDVVPWFIAIGNHNVEDPTDMDFVTNTLGARLAAQLEGMTNFREGPFNAANYWSGHFTTYSFDYQNAHFVILNQFIESESTDPRACPFDALLEWLGTDLSSTVMPLIFVFGHEPAWPRENEPNHCGDSLDDGRCPGNTPAPPDEWKFIRPKRDEFWQILRDHNAVAHFDGHTHQSAARPVHGITDFDMASCVDTEWNCYCMIEGDYPEAVNGGSYTPADGTVDFNDGMTMAGGPVNIIRVNCTTVTFGIYDRNDADGTLTPTRVFDFTVE